MTNVFAFSDIFYLFVFIYQIQTCAMGLQIVMVNVTHKFELFFILALLFHTFIHAFSDICITCKSS